MATTTTIKVVAKGPKWTVDTPQKAADRHKYVKAEGGGELLLSGAQKRWADPQHAGDVYVPKLRLVGTPAQVITLLRGYGIQDAQIQGWIDEAYTAQNYQTVFRDRFLQEIAVYEQYKKAKELTKKGPVVTLADVTTIFEAIKGGVTIGKPTTVKTPTGRGGRSETLLQRLTKLEAGKVIDVSNMKDNGTGAKTIKKPGGASKKRGVEGLNIVSSDFNNYKRAVEMLGAGYERYIALYQQQLTAPLMAMPAVGIVGVGSPVRTSPRGSPVAIVPIQTLVPTAVVPLQPIMTQVAPLQPVATQLAPLQPLATQVAPLQPVATQLAPAAVVPLAALPVVATVLGSPPRQ